MVEGLKVNIDAKFDSSALFAEMKAASKSSGHEPHGHGQGHGNQSHPSPAPVPAVVFEPEPNHELIAELEAQGFLEFKEEPSKPLAAQSEVQPTSWSSAQPPPPAQAGKPSGVEETIRISLSKLENLLNYVGEMVILPKRLAGAGGRHRIGPT
ncbi:MAG: hypothetical protein IPK04_06045 [Bdellovibrionales bacterium]|nr:hypothetical protein [Bdellovibrionales bacterium]